MFQLGGGAYFWAITFNKNLKCRNEPDLLYGKVATQTRSKVFMMLFEY